MASWNKWLDGTFSRKTLRQLDGALMAPNGFAARPLGANTGVSAGIPKTIVSCPTATTWRVGPHTGVLDLESDVTMGPSTYVIDANAGGSINAAHATLDRIDLLYVFTLDSTQTPATVTYLAGTAASSPVAPATPANGMALATLRVPGGGGSPAITWVAPWAVALGGIRPVSGPSAYPTVAYEGQYLDDPNLGLRRYDGASWGSLMLQWQYKKSDTPVIASGAFVKFVLNTQVIDTAGIGLTGGAFVAPFACTVRTSGAVGFGSSSAGRRAGGISLNPGATPSPIDGSESFGAANSSGITLLTLPSLLVPMNAGDVLALIGYQDSGSSLAVGVSQLTVELT